MEPATISTIFTTFSGNISSIITTNLPLILVISAGLIGLGILYRYVRKWIGRK